MLSSQPYVREARQGWTRLLTRPVSRRAGFRAGALVVAGLLGAVVAGCGEDGEEEEEEDD